MLYTYPWWIEHLFYLLSVICVLFLYSEGPLKWADQYKKDVKEYYNKIKELNDILNEDGKFSCVEVWPRFPRPDCFYPWYKMYRMKNTSPSNTSYLLFLFLFFPVPEQVRSSWIFNSHPLVSCYQLVWRADNLHSLVYPSIQQQLCFSFSHWGLLVIYCLTIIWVFMVSWQFEMTLIIYRIMYFSNHKSTIMRSARSVDSILLKVFHILLILVLIFVYRHHEACVI
jgi:hypothetical protein